MRWVVRFLWLLLFLLLTLATQIGGVAMLLTWGVMRLAPQRWRSRAGRRALLRTGTWAAVYALLTVVVVPPLARLGGRVPLQCFAGEAHAYQAMSPIFCAANRTYVIPQLRTMMEAMAADLAADYPGIVVQYLDASFPFIDGFPLIPHVSHNDGEKIDIAFFYQDPPGTYRPGLRRWPIGYWAFEQPRPGDPQPCADAAPGFTLRWDMGFLQPLLPDYPTDAERTAAMLDWMLENGGTYGVRSILLEAHLIARWDLGGPGLRSQGCRSGRHDDHFHVSVRALPGFD